MKTNYLFTIFSIGVFTLFACNEEKTPQTNSVETSDNVTSRDNDTPPSSPCELFSEKDLRNLIGLPDDLSIATKDAVLTHPTCKYQWNDKKVQRTTKVGSMEITTDVASEVMIVMASNVNESSFERSVSVYKDAIPVDNIADKAVWGETMTQLSFLKGNLLFHVYVKIDNDDKVNKEKAIEIADSILKKL